MPARRRTAASSYSGSSGIASPAGHQDDDEAYKLKRKRNNDAVKKTRERSKETAVKRKQHIDELKTENTKLEGKIESEKSNIKMLKDLLLNGVKKSDHDRVIKEILEATSEEDDDFDGSDGRK